MNSAAIYVSKARGIERASDWHLRPTRQGGYKYQLEPYSDGLLNDRVTSGWGVHVQHALF